MPRDPDQDFQEPFLALLRRTDCLHYSNAGREAAMVLDYLRCGVWDVKSQHRL